MSLLLGNLRDLLGDPPEGGWTCPPPDAPIVGDDDRRGDPEGILPPTGATGPTARHDSSTNSRGS